MRVADFIFKYLADYGIKIVFLITGGGAMHLNDAIKKEKRLKFVCFHHEQGAAIAAEGYSRTKGSLAVVCVSSGPGGTNTLTGVIGQWLDSIPVLYLSGQVKFETTVSSVPNSGLRQLGDQETNIVEIVKSVTKYSAMVTDPTTIKAELEKAIQIATEGRPGPVWLDIPLDVQGALIDAPKIASYRVDPDKLELDEGQLSLVMDELQKAKRPLLIAGHGIRIAQAKKELHAFIDRLGMPVVTTFNGFDLIENDSDTFVGRIGTLGSRAGNFALQNADLVLSLGTRNNIRQISYNWQSYAKNAKKIIIDIDNTELHKKTVKGDILVNADAKVFLRELIKKIPKDFRVNEAWLAWCLLRKKKYPVVLDLYRKTCLKSVHPYVFVEQLTYHLDKDAVVVSANGSACVVLFQAGIVKSNQRIFWNSGCASMGYALPASIGAALACNKPVICLIGDGCLQMNIQELQTIKHYALPIKLFVLNNHGYRSIEQTQSSFFNGDYIGCNEESGVSFPNLRKVADLYDLSYVVINSTVGSDEKIQEVLKSPTAVLCEVVLDKEYIFAPKLSSEKTADGRLIARPLEDLYPFLDRAEFNSNMIPQD
ncbi:MAG: thiamine pyrophosphate-binding protein [Legionellaceae bacterium]|nr:thiamine pyrophosphate-binding protein [Legionellaceae bacterium]